jgi:hypothetical protein
MCMYVIKININLISILDHAHSKKAIEKTP